MAAAGQVALDSMLEITTDRLQIGWVVLNTTITIKISPTIPSINRTYITPNQSQLGSDQNQRTQEQPTDKPGEEQRQPGKRPERQ